MPQLDPSLPSTAPSTQRTAALFARAPGLHVDHLRALFGHGAGFDDIAALPPRDLQAQGLPPAAAQWLGQPDESLLQADLRWLDAASVALVSWGEPHYPPRLSEIDAPPVVLYVRGDVHALRTPQLAMIGSRAPSGAGRDTAIAFARDLARAGLTITSGLARGIDAACHEGALRGGGQTVAVCGTGLDQVYPAQHAELAERIAAQGALVSEFPPGTVAQRHHFPRRNRLISGLAMGTLVVEAARASGSLITARLAGAQGREVFALPGSIHSPLSYACHQLIRSGMATLVTSVADILQDLKFSVSAQELAGALPGSQGPPQGRPGMDKEYEILLDALGFEPAGVDALVDRTGLPSAQIASMLLILELDGHVEPQPGGRYGRRPLT